MAQGLIGRQKKKGLIAPLCCGVREFSSADGRSKVTGSLTLKTGSLESPLFFTRRRLSREQIFELLGNCIQFTLLSMFVPKSSVFLLLRIVPFFIPWPDKTLITSSCPLCFHAMNGILFLCADI